MASDKELKQLEQILKHKKRYVIKKKATRRDFDAVNGTIGDFADFVATLAEDLNKMLNEK